MTLLLPCVSGFQGCVGKQRREGSFAPADLPSKLAPLFPSLLHNDSPTPQYAEGTHWESYIKSQEP